MRSSGSPSSATSTTTRSRAPGWSRGTAPSRVASTRCAASWARRAWTARSSTRSSTTGARTPTLTAGEAGRCRRSAPTRRPPSDCSRRSCRRSAARRIPRRRLQRAYGLLARNGFGPDVCSSVSKRAARGGGPRGRGARAGIAAGPDGQAAGVPSDRVHRAGDRGDERWRDPGLLEPLGQHDEHVRRRARRLDDGGVVVEVRDRSGLVGDDHVRREAGRDPLVERLGAEDREHPVGRLGRHGLAAGESPGGAWRARRP